MKKIILSGGVPLFILLFISAFTFGQSVTITPQNSSSSGNTTGDNLKISSNNNLIGLTGFRYDGTDAAKTAVKNNNILLGLSGSGYDAANNIAFDQAKIRLVATQNWTTLTHGTKISFSTTQNDQSSPFERMVINHDGKIGIGNTSPTGKLHINHLASTTEPHLHLQSTGTSSAIIKATSTNAGEWENHFLTNASAASNLVYWLNSINSSTPLILTGEGDVVIERNASVGGKVIINNNAVPRGELDIIHNTANSPTSPHINLKTSVNASNGMIRMENSSGTNYFGQYFGLNSGTPANNFVSFDYNGTTPILDMQGNGNVKVSGFTTLGNDPAAPKIKVIELSTTMGTVSGGTISIAHGLTQSKIMSVSILVNATTNNDIPPSSSYAGFKYDYYISSTAIFISSVSGSDASILNRPVRLLVTYKQ